jgi:hypothetical protein
VFHVLQIIVILYSLKETPDVNGLTPLMLAVQKENAWMIQLLTGKLVSREAVDKKNNTVYHYAAVTSKNVIEVRLSSKLTLLPAMLDNSCLIWN